jgi:SAM-dependent methyltransferase
VQDRIQSHFRFLRDHFYFTEAKWPQFNLLMKTTEDLIGKVEEHQKVLILERCYFYGGYALFEPLFTKGEVTTLDCLVSSSEARKGRNASKLEHPDCIKKKAARTAYANHLDSVEDGSIDFVYIPNLLHHVQDQAGVFREISRVLKEGGECVIFDGIVRELHHVPDDYLRYTPMGLAHMFSLNGMKQHHVEYGSGVFDVIAYAWQQALEFFPEPMRAEKTKWFFEKHYPELQELDRKYPKNVVNPDKSFPMSYSVWASKVGPG